MGIPQSTPQPLPGSITDAMIHDVDASKVTGVADLLDTVLAADVALTSKPVQFASTLGVTGASTLAALSCTTLAPSGALTAGGPIKGANASVPAPPTAGAQAGGSPPAPVLTAGSTDTAGNITFGTGSAPALGEQVVVVFGTTQGATPRSIQVVATNAATGLKIPCTVAKSATGFSIGLAVAPAAAQANTVYAVDYQVIV